MTAATVMDTASRLNSGFLRFPSDRGRHTVALHAGDRANEPGGTGPPFHLAAAASRSPSQATGELHAGRVVQVDDDLVARRPWGPRHHPRRRTAPPPEEASPEALVPKEVWERVCACGGHRAGIGAVGLGG